ncbi:hypothetical protein [Treponema endosymbiont of Eucomonympha sp.]|uniref:hypothetical protein n=1 Tax=Treponema endosymbiont of Eucomonympha sp. TaxID=1580831 RepID=UPI000751901F|nr:hypothetical protein [Treponema endosymbiont of Eucomonympha sp.]
MRNIQTATSALGSALIQNKVANRKSPQGHTPNAETLAAMQEANDMLSGKIPVKWFDSVEELLADSDD